MFHLVLIFVLAIFIDVIFYIGTIIYDSVITVVVKYW